MLIKRPTTAMTRRSLLKSAGLAALGAAVGSRVGQALLAAVPEDPGAEAKRLASEAIVIGQDFAQGMLTQVMLKYDGAKQTWHMLDVSHEAVKKAITHEDLRKVTGWHELAERLNVSIKVVRETAAEVLGGTIAVRAKEGYCARHGHKSPHEGFVIETEFPVEGPLLCINCGEVMGPDANGSPA